MDADAGRHRDIVEVGQGQLDPEVGVDDRDPLADLVAPGPAIATAAHDEVAGPPDLPRTQVDLAVDGRAVDEVGTEVDRPTGDHDRRRSRSGCTRAP